MSTTIGDSTSGRALATLGISACLLGQPVRFDAGHKRDSYLLDTLGRYFDFRPVCPELAIGMGVPRQPIRLVRTPEGVRAQGGRDDTLDVTIPLTEFGRQTGAQLTDISGYVFKKGSPSCGMERVKWYAPNGHSLPGGTKGIFAEALMATLPLLPVEEEGRLRDPALRENFIERVLVYRRWQELCAAGLTRAALVDFHTRHKFLLLAHHPVTYGELGRWIAELKERPLEVVAGEYIVRLMSALRVIATRRKHTNVLQHVAGFLRRDLDREDRAELAGTIAQYQRGDIPLVVPLHLLKHHLRRHPHPYLARQWYFTPHPPELGLRNPL